MFFEKCTLDLRHFPYRRILGLRCFFLHGAWGSVIFLKIWMFLRVHIPTLCFSWICTKIFSGTWPQCASVVCPFGPHKPGGILSDVTTGHRKSPSLTIGVVNLKKCFCGSQQIKRHGSGFLMLLLSEWEHRVSRERQPVLIQQQWQHLMPRPSWSLSGFFGCFSVTMLLKYETRLPLVISRRWMEKGLALWGLKKARRWEIQNRWTPTEACCGNPDQCTSCG